MPKQKYFTQRLSAPERKLLHDNPDAFSKKSQDKLTQIVREDMDLLATTVTPIYEVEYGCNDYNSWSDYYYWYRINLDKKDIALGILSAYYGPCGENIKNPKLDVWKMKSNKIVAELWECRDVNIYNQTDSVFNCLRNMYFYNNYDNEKLWHMCVPYTERLCDKSNIDVADFVDADYPDKIYDDEHAVYKMIYTKQEISAKINELCGKITSSYIGAEKSRVVKEKQEIEQAYAVLRKYGLLPANAAKNNQKQHS